MDEVFLAIVDGARWVMVDRARFRLYVWKGGTKVEVYSIRDGEDLADWPCEPSAESAAAVVAEHVYQGH